MDTKFGQMFWAAQMEQKIGLTTHQSML